LNERAATCVLIDSSEGRDLFLAFFLPAVIDLKKEPDTKKTAGSCVKNGIRTKFMFLKAPRN